MREGVTPAAPPLMGRTFREEDEKHPSAKGDDGTDSGHPLLPLKRCAGVNSKRNIFFHLALGLENHWFACFWADGMMGKVEVCSLLTNLWVIYVALPGAC